MRFLKSIFGKQPAAEPPPGQAREPIGDAQFRRNVIAGAAEGVATTTAHLDTLLAATPPKHPGDLFYTLGRLSQYAIKLALIDWRDGIDPRPRLAVIPDSYKRALARRPDILVGPTSSSATPIPGWWRCSRGCSAGASPSRPPRPRRKIADMRCCGSIAG
ncbi:MAG: hypothetical protein ACKO1O_01920 [Erythrobacter sp.]